MIFVGAMIIVLLFDVIILGRRPHVPSNRETGTALSIYVGLAVAFGIYVWVVGGSQLGGEFFAGWLTEYSLSIDNLFIFIIIMANLKVPRMYQQYALLIGIVIALILRAIFIMLGAQAIEAWSWVFYIFGAFLIYTAVKLAKENIGGDEEDAEEESKLIKFVQKVLPFTESWDHGKKLSVVQNGKRVFTPMLLVILALGMTDLLFALDSIPAIFGLTQDPFLVLMANIFALMGLRQLYFLIGNLLVKLVYLGLGLAVLLAFIGLKLIFHAMHVNELSFINGGEPFEWAPEIPIWLSLTVIVGILVITTVLSLLKSSRDAKRLEVEQLSVHEGASPGFYDQDEDTPGTEDADGSARPR
ncbi:TerC/Alx family metal homeostasis membrane protein [Ornithinimicrobium cryptoxanthini]|uniref:TerC/Alx family metal homeostasis membrane protein n=1 Tax=Ornithinimicrobium cryptoxanthini TaxID=2934161 RepID=UPI0021187D14|nr:TerC/Alx family metal homeostasis membrane protein [Ornithinimicrobium cryptoxanthini]